MFPSQALSFSLPLPNMFATSFTPPFVYHPSSSTQYYRLTMLTPQPDIQPHNDDVDDDNDPVPPYHNR